MVAPAEFRSVGPVIPDCGDIAPPKIEVAAIGAESSFHRARRGDRPAPVSGEPGVSEKPGSEMCVIEALFEHGEVAVVNFQAEGGHGGAVDSASVTAPDGFGGPTAGG